jgi:hypothetical protein
MSITADQLFLVYWDMARKPLTKVPLSLIQTPFSWSLQDSQQWSHVRSLDGKPISSLLIISAPIILIDSALSLALPVP